MNMEEKLAKWGASIVGGSILLPILLVLVTFSVPKIISGEIINDTFLQKSILIAVLYSISVFLLATLQGKNLNRRLISWLYSVLFHASLLVYLGVFNNLGISVLALGVVEVVVLALSILGLTALILGARKIRGA
jgi:hypothetical protein